MKTKLNLIIFLAMFLSLIGISQTYEKKFVKPNIDKELKQKATKSYLTKKIKEALKKNNIKEANIYKNLANMLNISLNQNLLKTIEGKNTFLKDTKDFASGFLSGKIENQSSFIGSVVSDFTVVGDARDIYIQTKKINQNKEYDKFTLGLSIVGVALTATTILSAGGTVPAKVGVSILKGAKKSGKLTKSFSKVITKQIDKTINLKKIKFTDFKSFKKAINQKELTRLEKILYKLNTIKKETSTLDTIRLLKYIDNENDLKKITKLAHKYKKNTVGVLKVLGKSALRSGKWVVDFSLKLLSFIGVFLVTLLWLIT